MHLRVTCAIIEHKGKVLCAQRSSRMKLPLKWEFPGGKIEPEESEMECLLRECAEELNIEVGIVNRMAPVWHEYAPGAMLELIPYRCSLLGGEMELREHADAIWLPPAELPTLDWSIADVEVVENYLVAIAQEKRHDP